MKRVLETIVVEVLSFSSDDPHPVLRLAGFSPREWNRCLAWMDDTGLALYFLDAIEQNSAWVPHPVMQSLRNKKRANEHRTTCMERQFNSINRRFEDAGIQYAAVKGLTLTPDFCSDPSLRYQADFDYLTNPQDIHSASRILQGMGYVLRIESDRERVFVYPSQQKPERGDAQYLPSAPHSVELHLKIGDFSHLVWNEPSFLANSCIRDLHGSVTHVLPGQDSFVLQAVHVFHHLLDGWVKLSWLYEIAYFLDKRSSDDDVWQLISQNLAVDPMFREAIAVVVNLVAELFQVRVPSEVKDWIAQIRPAVSIWIEKYARDWAFGPNRIDEFDLFPASKLVLLLHQQYVPDSKDWRAILATRLLALKGLKRLSHSRGTVPRPEGKSRSRSTAREFRRIAFHLGSGIRYIWEIPKWWLLTRDCPSTRSYFEPGCRPAL